MRNREQALGTRNLVGAKVERLRKANGMRQKELLAQLQVRGISINASALSKLEGQVRTVTTMNWLPLPMCLVFRWTICSKNKYKKLFFRLFAGKQLFSCRAKRFSFTSGR